MRIGQIHTLIVLLAALLPAVASASESGAIPTRLEQQRLAFKTVYPMAELGDWQPAAAQHELLQDYILWPDLRAAWLRTRVRNNDYSEVEPFLASYATLKPARELRYQYALQLGKDGDHEQFFELYQAFFQGLDVPQLDCLALQAEIDAGREKRVTRRASEKWLVGRNQVDECDPVFAYLQDAGLFDQALYEQRFELTLKARQFAMARYLARSLDDRYLARARNWTTVASNPADFLEQHEQAKDSPEYRDQLAYATERVAYRQPATAHGLWGTVRRNYAFTQPQKDQVERYIALWSARRHQANAHELLNKLAATAEDSEVRAWRVRTALRRHDWEAVASGIAAMPAAESAAEEWQFWLAQVASTNDDETTAATIYQQLASERSFYGFLAADALNTGYEFTDSPLVADEPVILELKNREDLMRARELFFVGLDGRGRSEWDAAIQILDAQEKTQASILAHRWDWHSRAIATVAKVGHYDDMQIRFPLPYRQTFEKHANASKIGQGWAYGVARSESLFMRDIRSSAGAIGLMQLMPETGRLTAREINHPYAGRSTLTDPDSNIRLGTAYLRKMLEQFDDNQVLATAAYNAGPGNVESWLPKDGDLDALVWIENIPFSETRKYVRRVFAMETIFHWRLTGDTERLSPRLEKISARQDPQQLANSGQH